MHKEGIEHLGMRINGVDVRHQECGRLRLACRDQVIWHEPAERVLVARRPEQRPHLREDVEGPCITRVLQLAIALWGQEL